MKILMELAEAARGAQQVFLPNRYQEPFIEAFQSLTGDEVPKMEGRKLTVRSGGRVYRLVRGRNIPRIVEAVDKVTPGVPTIGLTGSEWCVEYTAHQTPRSINWGMASEKKLGDVALIASKESDISLIRFQLERGFKPVPVVTAYPNSVMGLGASGRFNIITLLPVDGAVESTADALGIPGVDLVSTGQTLEINDFMVVEKLFTAYPALVTAIRQGQEVA